MIDYEQWRRIRHLHDIDGLKVHQIARELGMDMRTVRRWLAETTYRPRHAAPRTSKLDPFKPYIKRLLETHPYTAVQIYQRLQKVGYDGGLSILREYLRIVRPKPLKAFLTLHFEPGECAQVDWGQYGSVAVGNTLRRLSFFVMVLCHSRLMYVEFTVSQTMEHWLGCHVNAFNYFGGRLPARIMVDNLKSAVISRLAGAAPLFNPRYVDFARHHGFEITPCNVGAGNEKGRVENAVGYVKKNFLAGLEIPDFSMLAPAAREWLDEVANVRVHGQTQRKPVEMFAEERDRLQRMPEHPYDCARVFGVRANNRFRIQFEGNRYSVPAEYANAKLRLKVWQDRLCVYRDKSECDRDQRPKQGEEHAYGDSELIARHVRSYERNRDFEHPDHPRALLEQRRSARAQQHLQRFLMLSPHAERYYQELRQRRFNVNHHVQKIVALAEIYGDEATARALEDALHFGAFSCEYVANLLDVRSRDIPQSGALHLTRRSDLLDIDIPDPDLSAYDQQNGVSDDNDDHPRDTDGEPA